MYSDVEKKMKKGNKILFSRKSSCLQDLIGLMELQKHRTLVMWALDCAKEPLKLFETKYPEDNRLGTALELCEAWARGEIKMPVAKRSILDAHRAATEIDDKVCIALCHAIGHAGATVHVKTHALGLVFYELTAIVLSEGRGGYDSAVKQKINYYWERLLYWQENTDKLNVSWAKFLHN